jgi:hypothetical protein
MKGFVSYLSKPNYEARDAQGRFEGTFRWPWLASIWATLHPQRPMHLSPVLPSAVITSHAPAVAAKPVAVETAEPARTTASRTSSTRRSTRRRPAAQRAA